MTHQRRASRERRAMESENTLAKRQVQENVSFDGKINTGKL